MIMILIFQVSIPISMLLLLSIFWSMFHLLMVVFWYYYYNNDGDTNTDTNTDHSIDYVPRQVDGFGRVFVLLVMILFLMMAILRYIHWFCWIIVIFYWIILIFIRSIIASTATTTAYNIVQNNNTNNDIIWHLFDVFMVIFEFLNSCPWFNGPALYSGVLYFSSYPFKSSLTMVMFLFKCYFRLQLLLTVALCTNDNDISFLFNNYNLISSQAYQ